MAPAFGGCVIQGTSPQSKVIEIDIDGLELGGAPILGALSFFVSKGETLAIQGPSGIGKTTLLRVIAGVQSGFLGRRVAPDAMGFVFQEPTLLPWRSALQNITIATGCSVSEARDRLAEVGLAAKADLFPGQLSLGQQRRLALARAFAAAPDVLLMDEPFVSLDPELLAEMVDLFSALRARHRMTTVLVTHSEAEARALADRILTLAGPPAEIACSEML